MFTVSVLLDSVEKVEDFISRISKYACSFDIESGHTTVDAKSMIAMFSLDLSQPLRLTINDDHGELEDILRDIGDYLA